MSDKWVMSFRYFEDFGIKISETSFHPLKNNSVTIRLNVLLASISPIILHIVYSKDWWLFKNIEGNIVEDFVVKNFDEYFKSTKEKLCSKLYEKQNNGKIAESFYIFPAARHEAKRKCWMMPSNSFDNCV